MRNKKTTRLMAQARTRVLGASLGAAMCSVLPVTSHAFQLDFGPDSELSGSFDVSLGYGLSARTEDADRFDLVPAFGGNGANFTSEARVPDRWDITSNVVSTLGELGLKYRNYGLKGSFAYARDFEIMNRNGIDPLTGDKVRWNSAARNYAGSNFDTLDLYVFGSFNLAEDGSLPLEVRAGKQVINWGEGLFFVDSVAQQVPLNINKLTTPGTELKEGFIGVESLYAQLGIGDTSSLEAYYQFKWRRTEFAPTGTFFGSDTLFRGGTEAIPSSEGLFGVPLAARDPDVTPDDSGQWGVAFRTQAGDDTEVGVYYSRYHETWPFIAFDLVPDGTSVFDGHQYWPEKLDMFGASIATTLGNWSFNGEVAYRPDRPVWTQLGVVDSKGRGQEIHDTAHASVHGIWLGPAIDALGIGSQVALLQLGVDWIGGDTSSLAPQGTITRDAPGVPTSRTPDKLAWGVAGDWTGTWFSALGPGNDLDAGVFLSYDFSGNSHFWGNFAEDRLQGALRLVGRFGNALEAGLTYSFMEFDKSDFEDQDQVILNVNYKF